MDLYQGPLSVPPRGIVLVRACMSVSIVGLQRWSLFDFSHILLSISPLCLCLSFSFAHARALPLTSPSLRPLLLFCSLHPLRFELSSLDHVSLVALFLSGVFSLPIQTETLLLSQLARNPPFDPSLSRSWRSDHRTAKRKNLAYSMARRSVLLLFVIAVVVGCRRRRRCRRSFRVLLWPIPRPSSLTRSCSSSSPCYHPCVLMEIGGFVLSHVYHPGHLHR